MQTLSPLSLSAPAPAHGQTGIAHTDGVGADQFPLTTLHSPLSTSSASQPENARAHRDNAEAFSSPALHTLLPERSSAEPCDGSAPRHFPDPQCSMLNDQCSLRNDSRLTAKQLHAGARRLNFIVRAHELRAANVSWEQIERSLSTPAPTLIRWIAQAAQNAAIRLQIPVFQLATHHSQLLTSSDCSPQNHKAGRPRKFRFTPREESSIAANLLQTNRTEFDGSVQEAVRMARRKGELSPELLDEVNRREAAGLPLLPESLQQDVSIAPAVYKQFRNPTDADLDFICAPGTMMWVEDELTGGQKIPARAGDILEADDATINFPVCIPWQIGGCKVSDRWGVKVGRFQWLVAIDVASRYIPGFSYTARPRGSYRAEDIVSLLLGLFRAHGIWRRCRFERGVFESNLVTSLLANLGILHFPVWSPHQKPFIEGLFNALWTKLSDMPGQVGRFQGEMEEGNTLLTKCLSGSTDPRRHFPMIEDALAAMQRVIAEKNNQPIHSKNYGTWIPAERWEQQTGRASVPTSPNILRSLDPSSEFLFAPWIAEWTVQGALVGGSVRIIGGTGTSGGWSVRFDFGAAFLLEFDGCKVKAYFDPSTTRDCVATIVLAENVRSHRAGEVLGVAPQLNEVARYARRMLGYASDPDLGLQHRQKAASALRREVRAIKVGSPSPRGEGRGEGLSGQIAYATSEVRDGLGAGIKIEIGSPSPRGEGRGKGQSRRSQKTQSSPVRLGLLSPQSSSAAKSRQQADLIKALAAQTESEDSAP